MKILFVSLDEVKENILSMIQNEIKVICQMAYIDTNDGCENRIIHPKGILDEMTALYYMFYERYEYHIIEYML